MQVEIIRWNGQHENFDVPFHEIPEMLKCSVLNTVNLGDGRLMLTDAKGVERRSVALGEDEMKVVEVSKPDNAEATAMYEKVVGDGRPHPILGDVAIVPAVALAT